MLFRQLFSSYMYVPKQCLYKKFVRKMLMKLTPVGLSLKPLTGIERAKNEFFIKNELAFKIRAILLKWPKGMCSRNVCLRLSLFRANRKRETLNGYLHKQFDFLWSSIG